MYDFGLIYLEHSITPYMVLDESANYNWVILIVASREWPDVFNSAK